MSAEFPVVLLIEDSLLNGARIERMILSDLPECRLVWARNIEEAQLRAIWLGIDLFLVDVELPDGNGLDFLCEMATVQPKAQAIVLTSMSVAKNRERSAALGVLRFLEKPVDLGQLKQLMRVALDRIQSGAATDGGAFQASLNNLTPVDILQLKCLTQASASVEFRSDAKVGRVHIVHGNIVHAEAGPLSGMPAFTQIMRWKGGKIVETALQPETPQTINGDWQALLMEAAQQIDEQQ